MKRKKPGINQGLTKRSQRGPRFPRQIKIVGNPNGNVIFAVGLLLAEIHQTRKPEIVGDNPPLGWDHLRLLGRRDCRGVDE